MVPKQQFFIAFGLHESTHDGTSCIQAYLKGPCDTFLRYPTMALLLGPLASRMSCHISLVGATVLEATHLEGEMGMARGGNGLICGPNDGPARLEHFWFRLARRRPRYLHDAARGLRDIVNVASACSHVLYV